MTIKIVDDTIARAVMQRLEVRLKEWRAAGCPEPEGFECVEQFTFEAIQEAVQLALASISQTHRSGDTHDENNA